MDLKKYIENNKTEIDAIKTFLISIIFYGLIINFVLYVAFGIVFNLYSWAGYGLFYWFIENKFVKIIRSIIKK